MGCSRGVRPAPPGTGSRGREIHNARSWGSCWLEDMGFVGRGDRGVIGEGSGRTGIDHPTGGDRLRWECNQKEKKINKIRARFSLEN